jgi:hypothetical protein
MQRLLNSLAGGEEQSPTKTPNDSESPMFEDDGLTEEDQMQMFKEHLDSLPEDDKEFLAAHISKEMAKLIGLVTGSQMLGQYFDSIANPDIALIPVPRAKAQEMLAKFQASQQAPTEGGEASQPQQAQPPTGPVGPMGQPGL